MIDTYDPITIFLIVLGLFSVGLFLLCIFLPREVPLAFVVKLVWWCRTLLILLIWNLLISPSNLKESLAGQSSLGCRFFPFITINISCHSHLACRVSVEKSAHGLTEVPLYAICFFSLIAFNISSLSLIFDSLITMYLGVFLLVYPFWDSMLPEFG